MRFHLLLKVIVFAAIASVAVAEDEVITWKEDVRGWTIRVDTTLGYGCFMYSVFESDTALRAQFNPNNDNFEFIIGNPNWKSLEEGKLYPMSVQFGNLTPWTGNGEGYVFGGDSPALVLSVPFAEDRADTFIDELMKMTTVRVKYEDKQLAYISLRGTYAAMQEVLACQRAMLDRKSSSDPFSSGGVSQVDPFE